MNFEFAKNGSPDRVNLAVAILKNGFYDVRTIHKFSFSPNLRFSLEWKLGLKSLAIPWKLSDRKAPYHDRTILLSDVFDGRFASLNFVAGVSKERPTCGEIAAHKPNFEVLEIKIR